LNSRGHVRRAWDIDSELVESQRLFPVAWDIERQADSIQEIMFPEVCSEIASGVAPTYVIDLHGQATGWLNPRDHVRRGLGDRE
jgi:hypothetical protein